MNRRIFVRGVSGLFIASVFLLLPTASRAVWDTDPLQNAPVVKEATGLQITLQAVSDRTGGVMYTWTDFRNGKWDIYAQRMGRKGNPRWHTNGIALTPTDTDQLIPEIVTDGNHGAIIVWMDLRSGSTFDLYAQRLSPSGDALWAANGAPVITASGNETTQAVLAEQNGGAFVAWEDTRNSDNDVYVQWIRSNGTRAWTGGGVKVTTRAGDQERPLLVSDGLGGIIVAWTEDEGTHFEYYAQRIRRNGTKAWGTGIPIIANTNDKSDLNAIRTVLGGAIFVWEETRFGTVDLFAQRLGDTNGTRKWDPDGVRIVSADGDQEAADVARDGRGGIIVVWEDGRGSNGDIYAQRVGLQGNIRWGTNGRAVTTVKGRQYVPRIISDHAQGAIIVWQDQRMGTNDDLFAARIGNDGTPVTGSWKVGGRAVTKRPGVQYLPQIVPDGRQGAIIGWHDTSTGVVDIYAQQVSSDGDLGDVPSLAPGETILDDEENL